LAVRHGKNLNVTISISTFKICEQLSYLLIDVLNKHFSVSDISDNTDRFRTTYHIGGIYNDMLLWFSHGMTETAEEMVRYSIGSNFQKEVSLFFN